MVSYLQNILNRIERPENLLRPRPLLRYETAAPADLVEMDTPDENEDNSATDDIPRQPQRPSPKRDFRPLQRRRPASPPSDTQPDAAARRQSEDDGPTRAMPTEQRPVIPQQRADWQAAPVQRGRQAPEMNSPPPPTPERDPDGKRVQPTPLKTPARPFFAPEPPVIPPRRTHTPEQAVITEQVVERTTRQTPASEDKPHTARQSSEIQPASIAFNVAENAARPPDADSRAQHRPADHVGSDAPPRTVHVSIGRVEIKANTPQKPERPEPTKRSPTPALSLSDYLKRRNEGGV